VVSTYLTEVHSRFAQPFLALATALIGFATLLLGAFSRFGLWRQIIGAVVLLVVVQMINNAAISAAARSTFGWPLIYVAPVLGLGLSAALLWIAQRPRRKHRAGAAGVTA
jgi:lipopolysaccharide export system permease protein